MRIALPRTSSNYFTPRFVHRTPYTTLSRISRNFSHPISPEMAVRRTNQAFVREDLEDLMKRRFFVSRSFDIYGGVAGLYDLGVPLSHLFASTDNSLLDVHFKPTL